MDNAKKKIHESLNLVGFRALATAAGLLQLTRELETAALLPEGAIDRIQEAMVQELLELAPRHSLAGGEYESRLRKRLSALFAGSERVSQNPIEPPLSA